MTLHNHDFISGAHHYNRYLIIQQLWEWKRIDFQDLRIQVINDNLYIIDLIYNLLCVRDVSLINIYINVEIMHGLSISISSYTGTEKKYVSGIYKSFMKKHEEELNNIKVDQKLKLFIYKYKENRIPIQQRRYYDNFILRNNK